MLFKRFKNNTKYLRLSKPRSRQPCVKQRDWMMFERAQAPNAADLPDTASIHAVSLFKLLGLG
jgi:hypothetical protein